MRNINCKKCGMSIDASLGECPHCGAVYYILSEEDKKLEWAMNPDAGLDDTRVLRPPEAPRPRETARDPLDLETAGSDELFNTRVIRPQAEGEPRPAAPRPPEPVRRAAPPRPPVQERTPARRPPVDRYTGQEREKKTQRRQFLVAGLALLALLTLLLSLIGGLFDFGGKEKNGEKMPNVLGYTEATAVSILEDLGLKVSVVKEIADAPEGEVIRQSVKEEKIIRKGDQVTLTVSLGKTEEEEYIDVPPLTGSSYDEAKQLLNSLGLGIARGDDVFSDKPLGEIVSQSPMKGAKLQKGDTVTVTLSKGLEPSPTPPSYRIAVTAGSGGTVDPRGTVTVEEDGDITFTFTPDSGYEVREVKVDGKDIGAVSSYTFTKVRGDHTIYVVFRQKAPESPSPSPSPSAPPISENPLDWLPENPLDWWLS